VNLETFFEKFELFADAPGAVAKMREMVLELAVQGKLVPQDPEEEPALRQLKRITIQKTKTGRIARNSKSRAVNVDSNDSNSIVPLGWTTTTLAELVTILNGRAYSKEELLSGGTPVLRVGNLFTSNHWY